MPAADKTVIMHADNTALMHNFAMHGNSMSVPCTETTQACVHGGNTPMRSNSTPVHVGCCKWQRIDMRLATKGW